MYLRICKQKHLNKSQAGTSLVEVMIAVTIGSILLLVLGSVFKKTYEVSTATDVRGKTDIELRSVIDKVSIKVMNANEFVLATTTEIIFKADMNTDPNYQPNGDSDGDGLTNINDPDVDGDAHLIKPPTAQWLVGYNLKDDDDDNDQKVDMRWKIYLATRAGIANSRLCWDYSKNQEAWGVHISTLLEQVVSTGAFVFYGSRNDLLAPGTTTYDLNSNGMITMWEMDSVSNGGDGNGRLNTANELRAIVTVGITIDKDRNRDGAKESGISTEILPPMLYLKRRP